MQGLHKPFFYCCVLPLKKPEPIYMRAWVIYVFESPFSAETIKPICMIFGTLNKEWCNFKKMVFTFL